MRKATLWWLTASIMVLVGFVLGHMHDANPSISGLSFAGDLGWAIGLALIPLVIGIATKFNRPMLVLGVWAFLAFGSLAAFSFHRTVASVETGTSQVAQSAPSTETYFHTVVDDAMTCSQNGGNIADCYVKASPKRCTQQALAFASTQAWTDAWIASRQQLAVCVNSCSAAGSLDKLFGDCSRG